MTAAVPYASSYSDALGRFVAGAGEDALSEAYDVGRRALASGLGILDMVYLHQDAVRALLCGQSAPEPARLLSAADTFFLESLSPFAMHFQRVDESSAAWRRLNELLEEEVRRIARALHDEAGSILAQAGLEMDLATDGLPAEAREKLASARRLLDDTGEQLRQLSHELRPPILDDLGILRALEFLAERVEKRTGLSVHVRGELRERLAPPVEIAVYRVVQEALNNTLRHGGESSSVAVSIGREPGFVHCVVVDDGVGFDVDTVLADARRHGLGLLGMRERVEAIGGECVITSAAGQGTRIELKIPA